MYKHTWHQRIAQILEALPAKRLAENKCYFGGGTALVFQSVMGKWKLGEYRLSDDIDFLCTAEAFLAMRRIVAKERIAAITGNLTLAREPRIDPYGIRTVVVPAGAEHGIRFEIVCDAALPLHTPGVVVSGVTCLSLADSTSHKLMANFNRYADRATGLRDYVDLLVIAQAGNGLPPDGIQAAFTAFDEKSIMEGLHKAHHLLGAEGFMETYQLKLTLNPATKKVLSDFAKLSPEVAAGILLKGPFPHFKK